MLLTLFLLWTCSPKFLHLATPASTPAQILVHVFLIILPVGWEGFALCCPVAVGAQVL